jgi:hypothetical protein
MRLLRTMAAACLLAASAVGAHPLPGSAVLLDFQEHGIETELQLRLDQLELSFKQPLVQDPVVAQRLRTSLQEYILRHVHPVALDGRPWRVTVTDMHVTPAIGDQPIELNAHLQMTPPTSPPVRRLRFSYDVFTHELMAHSALNYARTDWDSAVFFSHPEPLGTIR